MAAGPLFVADTKTKPFWRTYLAPLVLVLLLAAAYMVDLHEYLTLQAIAENRAALAASTQKHFWLSLFVFVVIYAAAVAVSFPGASVLTILAGVLFGWITGGLASLLAATLGAAIVFQVAKSSFGEVFASKAGPFLSRVSSGFAQDAFNYLLFLRLVPAFPFWLVNIAPALVNVRFRTFVSATVIGIIPGTFAFASLGTGLDSIIAAQQAARSACLAANPAAACPLQFSISSLVTTELLLAFAALGFVALIPVVLKKWKARDAV